MADKCADARLAPLRVGHPIELVVGRGGVLEFPMAAGIGGDSCVGLERSRVHDGGALKGVSLVRNANAAQANGAFPVAAPTGPRHE